ncbi:MAG: DUF6516 family protein [Desulfobacterales bacterium]
MKVKFEMLHDILSRYLDSIEAVVREIDDAYIERYEEEILAFNRINLRIRVRFKSGYLFELNEAAIVEADQFKRLNYRYHFQDSQNNLVFRYDNTPHFPDLESFPHHKHLSNNVISSEEPSAIMAIEEAIRLSE